jgi:hypothetical protein
MNPRNFQAILPIFDVGIFFAFIFCNAVADAAKALCGCNFMSINVNKMKGGGMSAEI